MGIPLNLASTMQKMSQADLMELFDRFGGENALKYKIDENQRAGLDQLYGNSGMRELSDDQLQYLGLQKYQRPKPNSSTSGMPDRVSRPDLKGYEFNKDTLNYPTWLKNLGEQNAQKAFQTAVNQGVGAGGGAQAYQKAFDARNNARMQYMAQAGQEAFGVESKLAEQQNIMNELATRLYGLDVNQRGQDMSYLNALRGGGGGGGYTMRLGGGGSSGSRGGGGSYIGLGGRTTSAIGPSSFPSSRGWI